MSFPRHTIFAWLLLPLVLLGVVRLAAASEIALEVLAPELPQ